MISSRRLCLLLFFLPPLLFLLPRCEDGQNSFICHRFICYHIVHFVAESCCPLGSVGKNQTSKFYVCNIFTLILIQDWICIHQIMIPTLDNAKACFLFIKRSQGEWKCCEFGFDLTKNLSRGLHAQRINLLRRTFVNCRPQLRFFSLTISRAHHNIYGKDFRRLELTFI